MKGNPLFKNSSFSVLQTVATAFASLLLFKLMVMHLGLKITGLWSFLSSITTITAFGSFGFANALLYYIPKYKISHSEKKLKTLINTTFISVLGLTIILCFLAYIIFYYIIPVTVSAEMEDTAKQLLPFVVTSFFFAALSTIYLSVLDGLLLMHIRAKINIAGAAIFLGLGFILLLKIGIIGIPIAQLIQNIFLLFISFIYTRKKIPVYRFSLEFEKAIFKDIFKYGFNFQLISITQIISEPFMKAMITKFAGTGTTAIYDFCLKLMSVFRSLLISINQVIVPQITIFKTLGNHHRIKTFYKTNFKVVLLLSILFFLSPVVLSDAISIFFLNKTDSDFNFILLNVSLGLMVNAIAFPAHFYYLGVGNLKWNVLNNIITAVLIFISAPILGKFVGGEYMVLAWSVPAIVGSSVLIWAFCRQEQFSIFSLFDKNIFLLILSLFIAMVTIHFMNGMAAIKKSHLTIFVSNIVVLTIALYYPLSHNMSIKKMKNKIRLKFSR